MPVRAFRKSKKKPKKERPHFAAILGFVYRNRFAVASQIQRRFSNILRSDRTARRHLEELESLRHLGVAPGRGVGPLFPKVYFVTGKGVLKLRDSLAKQGRRWQPSRVDRRGRHAKEGYSADRIVHEILITEFLLAVWQTIDRRADLELLSVQRRSLAKHPAFRVAVHGRQTRLLPDAMFVFRQRRAGMVCCLLELDNGTMNRKQIKAKYARYDAWSRSERGQQYLIDLYRRHGAQAPKPTFRLVVVGRSRTGCNDEHRVSELVVASKASSSIRQYLWLTSVDVLREHQSDDLPLDAPIWLRGRDADCSESPHSTRKKGNEFSRQRLFPAGA